MGWKEEMKKAADEGDEEAKAALAALEDEDKDDDEKKDSKKSEDEDGDKKAAEDEKDEKKSEDEDDEKKKDASSASRGVDAEAIARVGALEREIDTFKAEREEKQRAEILSQYDLTDSQIALLKKQPIETMKSTVASFATKKSAFNPAAPTRTSVTLGKGRGDRNASVSSSVADEVDRRMGLAKTDDRPRWEGRDRIFPGTTMSKETAREVLEANRKAGRGIR